MSTMGPQALPEQTYQAWVAENITYYQGVASENVAYFRQVANENIAYFRQRAAQNIAYYQEAASNYVSYYGHYIKENVAYYTQAAKEMVAYYLQAAKAKVTYYLQAARLNMGYAVNYVKESVISFSQRAKHFVTHFRENATWAMRKGVEYTQYYASRAGHYIKAGYDNAQYYLSQGFTWGWHKLYQGYRWMYAFAQNRWQDLGRLIRGTWSALKWVANGLWSGLKEGVYFLGRTSLKLYNALKDGVHFVLDGLKKLPGLILNAIEKTFEMTVRFIKASWAAIKDAVNFLTNAFKLIVEKSFALIEAFIRNSWVLVKEGLKFLGRTLNQLADFSLRALKNTIEFIKAIPDYLAAGLRAIQSGLTVLKDSLVTFGEVSLRAMRAFASQVQNLVVQGIRSIGTFLQNSAQMAVDTARLLGNTFISTLRSIGHHVWTMAGQFAQAVKVMAHGLIDVAKAIYQNFGQILPKLWEGVCALGNVLKSAITPIGEAIKFAAGKVLNVLGGVTGVARFMLDKIAVGACIVYAVADLFVGWVGSVLASFVPQAAVSFLTTTLPFGGLIATGAGLVSTGLSLGLTLGTLFFAGYGMYRGVIWAVGQNAPQEEAQDEQKVDHEEVAANDALVHKNAPRMLHQYEGQRKAVNEAAVVVPDNEQKVDRMSLNL